MTDADLDLLERRATAGERVVMQVDGATVAALVREVRAARSRRRRRQTRVATGPCWCVMSGRDGCDECGGSCVQPPDG